MAKNIIMQVLTSAGYEPMYPFSPNQVLNGTFLASSTASQYNISITGVSTPITNAFGNSMGIISFIPTINNNSNVTLSINGDTAKPILFANGAAVNQNTLISGRPVMLKYNNNNFYLLMDKNQIGLSNVDNTSDMDKPISNAVARALNNKLDKPIVIPSNANLNTYTEAGLYYFSDDTYGVTNKPTDLVNRAILFVQSNKGTNGNGAVQTYYVINTWGSSSAPQGMLIWTRTWFQSAGWTPWYQMAYVLSGTGTPSNSVGQNGNIYIKYS